MTHSKRRKTRHALPILLGLLVGTSCVANPPRLDPVPPSDPVVRIELTPGGAVVMLGLEDYVIGSILAEADVRGLGANAAQRVAQVQAVLARTYALANRTRHAHEGFDLCSTTHCQVYRPPDALSARGESLARSASRVTAGLVITYDGLPINALFHADCGGSTSDATVAWVGDGNNVARSLAIGCAKTGIRFVAAMPTDYQLGTAYLERIRREVPGAQVEIVADPIEAVREADAVYTDVWASMGQEGERSQRMRDFAAYQVNAALMAEAPERAIFMHCMPAHRGQEVTADVIDGPQSVVFRQAANRMHVQKGVLAWLLGPDP